MVGKEPYEADAGGIGFLFPFRYLSCHMKIKPIFPRRSGTARQKSHQISGLPDTLMMTDYKGRAIKMSSDMANEKYRNLRKIPCRASVRDFSIFICRVPIKQHCLSNVSQCTSNDSVLLSVSYEIKADNRKLAAESSKTVTQSETKSLLP